MKQWFENNWLKLAIGLLVLERVVFYMKVLPYINSFMQYVENSFASLIQ